MHKHTCHCHSVPVYTCREPCTRHSCQFWVLPLTLRAISKSFFSVDCFHSPTVYEFACVSFYTCMSMYAHTCVCTRTYMCSVWVCEGMCLCVCVCLIPCLWQPSNSGHLTRLSCFFCSRWLSGAWRQRRPEEAGKLNIFLSLLDSRLHKRFHSHLHQTSTVETTHSVFVAIKLPGQKK